MLHSHPTHRARQLKWVLPVGLLLTAATLAALGTLYYLGSQDVGTEFFHAHKAISNTGELLNRGVLAGAGVLLLLALAVGGWALSQTHRIVRPVHTLHRAVDELVAGNLGARVELHRRDEFQEMGDCLNHLAEEFHATLSRIHLLVDRIEPLAEEVARGERGAEAELHALSRELNEAMEFFKLEPRVIREEES